MARPKKEFFGEETSKPKRKWTRRATTTNTTMPRRKYTRRVMMDNPHTEEATVTIQVPASFAFSIGYQLGLGQKNQ